MSGYAFHPDALSDLDEIWEFIATDNINAADRVVEEVFATVRGLVRMPHRGHLREDLTSRPLRFVAVREYVIAYAPGAEPLFVAAIFHGRRNPRLLAALLRARTDP